MTNELDQELNYCIAQLNEAQKGALLHLLKTFSTDGEGRISLDEYNLEIDEAEAEIATGNYVTQTEMEKIAAKWPLEEGTAKIIALQKALQEGEESGLATDFDFEKHLAELKAAKR